MKRVLVVVTLFVLTGCGGSGSGGTETSPGANDSTPSGPPFPLAAAQQAARQALLSIGDFPSGWSTSKDKSNDDNSKKFVQQLSSCLHAPRGLLGRGHTDAASEDSPDFDSPDGGDTTVSETVSVSRLVKVQQLLRVLQQTNATDCFASALNVYIKTQVANSSDPDVRAATVGDVQVGQVSFPTYGEESVPMRASIPVSANGFSTKVYVDLLFVRHANAVAILSFEATGTPVDADTEQKYAKIAADKLSSVALPTV